MNKMANQDLEQKTEQPYVVALPNLEGREYSCLEKIGTTFAVSEAEAIGNYLFRNLPRRTARATMTKIRDKLGGYEKFALEINLKDIPANQIIEIASFLSGVYKDRDARDYERVAERFFDEIVRYEKS
jgi:hypothetical protein